MKFGWVAGLLLGGALAFGQGVKEKVPGEDPPPLSFQESFVELLAPKSQKFTTPKAIGSVGGAWSAQGPAAMTGGQIEGITDRPVSGAIHTVVAHPTDADILWLGATNGGIWRTSDATAASPTWTPLIDDKVSLSIGAIDLDPTDVTSQTLVAGQGRFSSFSRRGGPLQGLYRTTDGGTTWTTLSPSILVDQNCSGVAARGAILLFSSNNFSTGGVFRSPDTGVTWSIVSGATGTGLPLRGVYDLVGDPNVTTRFYCSVSDTGIYRSDDTGATWILISDAQQEASLMLGGNNNTEIAVAPNGRVYAALVDSGQVLSIEYTDNPTDATPVWIRMDLPSVPSAASVSIFSASNTTPIVIATSSAHGLGSGNLVEIAGVSGNTAANGIFRVSVTNTTSFSLVGSVGNGVYAGGGTAQRVFGVNPRNKPGGQGGIHLSILADATDSNTVYIGGDRQDLSSFPNFIGATEFSGNLWRGDTTVAATGGSPSPQWEHLGHSDAIAAIPGGGTASGSAPHADSREMVFDANGNIIQGDDGGIYRRTSPADNTGDWFSLNGNLQVTEQHDIAYDTVSNMLIGGNQDTGTSQQTTVGGLLWKSVSTADGGDVAVDPGSVAPNSIRYSSFQNLGSFRRSTYDSSGMLTMTEFPALTTSGSGTGNTFVTPVEVNRDSPSRIVVGGVGIRESFNRGNTATELLAGVAVEAMSYGIPASADVLWAISDDTVYARTSGTGNPVDTGASPSSFANRDIVVDETDATHAFVVTSTGVFSTVDTGATWVDITGNIPTTDLRAIEYISGANPSVAVGGYGGVYVMTITTPGVWRKLGTGVPNVIVFDLDYDPSDDVIVAGTLGRGAWLLTNASINDFLGISNGAIGGVFTSSGDVGGPFDPTSDAYTLTNNTDVGLTWTVSADANWVDLSTSGSTIAAGGQETLTVTINSNADALAIGSHTATLTFEDATNAQTQMREVALTVRPPTIFIFDLDSDPGWSTEGLWAFGQPTGQGTAPGDPTSGNTGTNVYGYNLNGDYEDELPERSLTTTALDFSSSKDVTLNFSRWLAVESATFDSASVRVSNDGNSFTTVWEHTGSDALLDSSWSEQTIDISAVADEESTVFVRWVMGATDDSVTFPGWNIDDIIFSGARVSPRATSIVPDLSGPTNANTLSYVVEFSEDVTGFDAAADLVITETGDVAHSGVSISGGPQTYTVDITGISGDGSIGLAVSTVSDVFGEDMEALDMSVTSAATVIDNTAPSISLTAPTTQGFECLPLPYDDPGFSATDDLDGDITGNVVVSGDTGLIGMTGMYTILYDVVDAAGNAAPQQQRMVSVSDTSRPTITLLGDNPLELARNDTYLEPGATAADACAGNLTGDIDITGSVDTSIAGDYIVSYTVADPSGNSVQATRTVTVVGMFADVNGDEVVNSVDIQLVINRVLGIIESGLVQDVNGDMVVNSVDIQLAINAVLGV